MQVLITGGKGFLGVWIARRLLARGIAVRVFDVVDDRRLAATIVREAARSIEWRIGDIVEAESIRAAASGCDAIIHLAGILTPNCKENPVRGAQINLIGTLNVFEAARAQNIARIVYTSSAGVYGPNDATIPRPITHYGTFKLACEGSARAYWADHGLASIGFRPFVVYGPGRETGLTAGPSLACRAAALGESYTIPYTGKAGLIFVEDVAAAYEMALLREPEGAHVFNLVGVPASNEDVIKAIRRIIPGANLKVAGPLLPITPDVEEGPIDTILPDLPRTPLQDGIASTIDYYRRYGVQG
jgi:UDP-glucose 4-epimerase